MASHSIWLDAWNDPLATLKAYTPHLALTDIDNSGEGVLVVADLDQRLRLYKGTGLIGETRLSGIPSSVVSFRMFQSSSPCIAVAVGNSVFVYKLSNSSTPFRPYASWKVPNEDNDYREVQIWETLYRGEFSVEKAVDAFIELRGLGAIISPQANILLSLPNRQLQTDYIKGLSSKAFKSGSFSLTSRSIVVSTLGVLPKNIGDDSEDILVVAGENGVIYLLNRTVTDVLEAFSLGDVATRVAVTGSYDGEYRMAVATRNNKLLFVKNSKLLSVSKTFDFILSEVIISQRVIFVSSSSLNSSQLYGYSLKGKRLFCVNLSSIIHSLEPIVLNTSKSGPFAGAVVACSDGTLKLYNDNGVVVGSSNCSGVVTGLRFGLYGKDTQSLVIVTKSGALSIKILSRLAVLTTSTSATRHISEQDETIALPQKTRAFFDLAEREKDNAPQMFRSFQQDLLKLRYTTVQRFAETLAAGGSQGSHSIRLFCSISGLGPRFSIAGTIENVGQTVSSQLVVNLVLPQGLVSPTPLFKTTALIPRSKRSFAFVLIAESNGSQMSCHGDVRVECVCPNAGVLTSTILSIPILDY
ncbi:hypothetical protein RCL1_003241 [Eukaryota sp. TZLM3-RCL]